MQKLEAQINAESGEVSNYRNQLRTLDPMMKLTTSQSDEKTEKLRRELARVTLQFNSETQSARNSSTEVEVSFAAGARAGGKIELAYMVGNVSWNGVYDLRGSAEKMNSNWFLTRSSARAPAKTG